MKNKTKFKLVMLGLFSLTLISITQAQNISLGNFLQQYFDRLGSEIPDSSQYIQLKYNNITPNDVLYPSLQKAVYLNAFPNVNIELPYRKNVSEIYASRIILNAIGYLVPAENKSLTQERLDESILHIEKFNLLNREESTLHERIMQDIQRVLKNNYYNSEDINDDELSYGAIKGLVEAANDPYTKFFPPQEANDFDQEMEGEYEGIGAYIELPAPGKLIIISVFDNSPAQKAGLKGGDQITHINHEPITQYMSITNITFKVKGEKGTTVTLGVLRQVGTKGVNFDVNITRAHIDIKDLTTNYTNTNACILTLNMFDYKIYNSFLQASQEAKKAGCKQYIIDIRNNPGGSLEEVAKILDHFVPKGEESIIVKTKNTREAYVSEGLGDQNRINKKIIVLINKGSASASEIFAGTLKDYGPNVVIIGEQSFGKGTVQEVINYGGGAMLKVTIAKRFTGKTEKDIDGIGLKPDFTIIDNPNTEMDEQLEAAKMWWEIH